MKILFGEKYYGKDTSEVPSGFLVWIIEEYAAADWTLINACKQELSARLKIDWTAPKTDKPLKKRIAELEDHIFFMEQLNVMNRICNRNGYIMEGYIMNRAKLTSDLLLISLINSPDGNRVASLDQLFP